MSQVEETLGGLRIIKAFSAEEKMNARFDKINSNYRDSILKVTIRQQLAHPMSEFLGTLVIVIVLWFGGTLVLNEQVLSGPTFILLPRDALQHHQPVERTVKGELCHHERTGIHRAGRQDIEG